jgi:signal transduction histidine kinase/CheY-like chemotaxis protein
MDTLKRLANRYLFSEDLSRDARILNMICILGFLAGLASLTTRWAEGLPSIVVWVMITYLFAIIILFIIANYFNAQTVATWITLVALGDVIFPLSFFLTGGIDGAVAAWFVLSIFVVFFFASGLQLVVFLGIHIVAIITCFVLGSLHPELLYPINPTQRLVEAFTAIFSAGFFIGLTVKYLIGIYDNERKKAEAASRTKSNFLSAMSHEMRTPMNAIIGMTAIAQSTDDPARKDYALARINEASEHLLGVINDILDMSKIEAEKLELSFVDFSFDRMLQKVQTVIGPRIAEKKLSLSVTVDKDIPTALFTDDQRLTQVIINLLSNAVKFTDENGKIGLDASLLGEQDGLYEILVEISDTGIGLSDDQIERLFDSFEQAESGTARKYGGTGLGLSISKSIVDLLGGKIWVQSKPGEGSHFFFTFKALAGKRLSANAFVEPEARGTAGISGTSALLAAGGIDEKTTSSLAGKRVLLAEDNEVNREIVLTLLEPTGIVLDCAVNGVEAVEKFSAAPYDYDMILMDVMMPEMDGYEATRRIRTLNNPRAKQIPIVAMTANVFREDVERSLASGMNDHVGKPVDYNKLLETLEEYLVNA